MTDAAKERGGPGEAAKPVLSAGGNPQFARSYGNAPVQATIATMRTLQPKDGWVAA